MVLFAPAVYGGDGYAETRLRWSLDHRSFFAKHRHFSEHEVCLGGNMMNNSS